MTHTMPEIMNMTDAEVAVENTLLAKKVVRKYALFFGLKWLVIIASAHAARKLIERSVKDN